MAIMNFEMKGKVAAVTGGANGIGLATAKTLAASGASVCILDLDRENPDAVAKEIGGRGFVVDVTRRTTIDAAFDQIGPPDIVVANAGTATEASLLNHTAEIWERTLAINLTGAYNTIQSAALRMKDASGGAIVVTASTNSYDGESLLTAYNATKAGILGLIHTAANELGPYQIRINGVCPGLIRTRLTQRHFNTPEVLRDYFRHIPLGRGGEAEEVAHAICFLASDAASFITGATLFVDGGQMATKFGTWTEDNAEFSGGRWRLR